LASFPDGSSVDRLPVRAVVVAPANWSPVGTQIWIGVANRNSAANAASHQLVACGAAARRPGDGAKNLGSWLSIDDIGWFFEKSLLFATVTGEVARAMCHASPNLAEDFLFAAPALPHCIGIRIHR
jgi:hypothetical protein